jgi:signal transduction histidine kinase
MLSYFWFFQAGIRKINHLFTIIGAAWIFNCLCLSGRGAAALGKAALQNGQNSWPRLQFVYFIIAAFNLVAIFCGLYLSHLVIGVYQASVNESLFFDRQLTSSWVIADAASDAQSAFVKVLNTKSLEQAQSIFKSKTYEFRQEINRLRAQLPLHFDEMPAKRALTLMRQMDATMAEIEKLADKVALLVNSGDSAGAQTAVIRIVERYSSLRYNIRNLNQLVVRVKLKAAEDAAMTVTRLRNYEFYIGALMALVICAVAFYGQFMGRLLKRKFIELEKTHSELAASHEQAITFSKEIQNVNDEMGTLNRQLNENITKLREAQDEALRKGKMAQLGNLTATVAHELRNPLSTVRTSTYLLARKIKDKGLGVEPQLQRINNGVIRCDNIITQLLDFSRSKAVSAEPTVFDVWLEKLIHSEAQKLPELVSIECYFGLGDKLVDLEPGRFERAVINLLSNASEALVGKGDDPKARFTETPVITVRTRLTARGAEISVADNGPGISADNLTKIRDPLFTTKNFGTGLGISAVEQILEQHGGGLDIDSIEGKGATFTLWMPIHESGGEQAA